MSGIFALLNRRDPAHMAARAALLADPGPFIVPMGILAEVTYMIERTLHPAVLDAFLGDVETGGFSLDCGEANLPRIRACSPVQRLAARVRGCGGDCLRGATWWPRVTFDRRHFGTVARSGRIVLLPEP